MVNRDNIAVDQDGYGPGQGTSSAAERELKERMHRTRARIKVLKAGLEQAKEHAAATRELVEHVGEMLEEERRRKVALYEAPAATGAIN